MLLDLNKLHGQREHFQRSFEPSSFDPQDDSYTVVVPVALSMDVERLRGHAFRVHGDVITRLQVECSRCLDSFELPVNVHFECRYARHPEVGDDSEREVHEEDLATEYHAEGVIDVVEMLREQFQLALPMKPLCAESCKGLCAECGANLNRTTCGCHATWKDPRLSPLKELLTPKEK